jgi:hypothetical protein
MEYWRWLWGRLPYEAQWGIVGVLLLGLLGGGWVVASEATSSGRADVAIGSNPIVIETTIQKAITIRERGKIVRKVVPVVKRIKVLQRPGTVYETQREYVTQVVKTPGVSVTRTVSELVPVVRTRQIRVNGQPRIVIRTQFQPTTRTETVALTQTLVATQNVVQTQTAPPVTDMKTTTQTRTQTVTQTETRTVTDTQTVTVTPDPVTVTHTVTDTVTALGPGDNGSGGGRP